MISRCVGPVLVAALLAALMGLFACGDGGGDSAFQTVRVKGFFGLKANIPSAVILIELTVTGDGFPSVVKILDMDDFDADEDVVFEVDVTPGTRLFTVVCRDNTAFGLYRGSKLVEIEPADTFSLDIDLEGWGAVAGHVAYPDGTALVDYDETAFEVDFSTNDFGDYQVEAALGNLSLRIQPSPTALAFTVAKIELAGQQIRTDLVLIDPQDTSHPWISSVVPQVALNPGDTIAFFGQGFARGSDLTVWFGEPGSGGAGESIDVVDNGTMNVTVPTLAPATASAWVCWATDTQCSNPFPYTLE